MATVRVVIDRSETTTTARVSTRRVRLVRGDNVSSFQTGYKVRVVGTSVTGPIGPQGAQGAQGTASTIAGPQGVTGAQGAAGAQGAQGVTGAAGSQGSQGAQGAQGTQGSQGSQGAFGSTGLQGDQGPQGTQGPQGAQGAVGQQGLQGYQGVQGPQGDNGAQGVQGPTGAAGPQGNQGAQGAQGVQGAQGSQGVGVPTGGTIGQSLVKSSGSNYDTSWASVGSAARPLLTGGAYLSGSGLVLSGLASNYASTPDSAALSITGDIDIKVKVAMTDWTPAAQSGLIGKNQSGSVRSYWFTVESDGTLRLATSADGSTVSTATSSTVATGFTDGATKWVRATMDVDNGSSQRVVKFYTSDDGTTWTQLGTTVTTAGATSIFDTTAPVEIGTLFLGTQARMVGTVYRTIIQSAYDTANNTDSLVFDANFETATADALAFTESSGNAATVTINTTRYSYGVPNFTLVSIATISNFIPANTDRYTFFLVNSSTIIDLVSFEVTSGPSSNATVYYAIYAADNNFQPTGSPLFTDSQSVTASATGTFTKQLASAATLAPGLYAVGWNSTQNISVRAIRGGITAFSLPSISNTPAFDFVQIARTAATFPSNPAAWTVRNGGVSTALSHPFLFRWKAA